MTGGTAQLGGAMETSPLYSPDFGANAQGATHLEHLGHCRHLGGDGGLHTHLHPRQLHDTERSELGGGFGDHLRRQLDRDRAPNLEWTGPARSTAYPSPCSGRAPFGVVGVHVPAMARALVACGWFGVQTWIGGLAIHAIACTLVGAPIESGLSVGKFCAFAISWGLTLFFVWRGTESIRQLERLAAPMLLLVGLALMGWASGQAHSPAAILGQSGQFESPTAQYRDNGAVELSPLRELDGSWKADAYRIAPPSRLESAPWRPVQGSPLIVPPTEIAAHHAQGNGWLKPADLVVQFRRGQSLSSPSPVREAKASPSKVASWLFWITAMVGFWATMSISIADITRYGRSQRDQAVGQLLGLPGTMLLYGFVSVFVTCAALVGFDDILTAEDAPWDPVSLVAQFDSPMVVVTAQSILLVATLTTNIAANVVAPAQRLRQPLAPGAELSSRRIDHGRHRGVHRALAAVRPHQRSVGVRQRLPRAGARRHARGLLLGAPHSGFAAGPVRPQRRLLLSKRRKPRSDGGLGGRRRCCAYWLFRSGARLALHRVLVFRGA